MNRFSISASDQHPEVRLALLKTMRETPLLISAGVFWTQASYLLIYISLHSMWIAIPAGLDWVAACIRLNYGRGHGGEDEIGFGNGYDENIFVTVAWISLTAGEVCILLRTHSVEAVVLGSILAIGFIGYVAARFAAFPGVAFSMIGLLTLALTVGLLTSPFQELTRLGMMAPAAGIAFAILTMHAHDALIEAVRAKHENRQRSLHDPLTGLPNRLMMGERLTELCQGRSPNRSAPSSFAVLCLDLDGFKQVNDRFGHAAGDEVLIAAAKLLTLEVAGDGMVFRIGGDEFVVLLQSADRQQVAEVASRLVKALSVPFLLSGGVRAQLGATIGAALCPQNATSQDPLLSYADDALYEAKRAGKGRWLFAPLVPNPSCAGHYLNEH